MSISSRSLLTVGAPLLAALLLGADVRCGALNGPDRTYELVNKPAQNLYTSTRQVRALALDDSGGFWAATAGGLLHWSSLTSAPRRWTTADGLPSNDVLTVNSLTQGARIETRAGACSIDSTGTVLPADPTPFFGAGPTRLGMPPECGQTVTAQVSSTGGDIVATPLGLWRRVGGSWRPISLPPDSPASHVSALAASGTGTVAGLYGDGIYVLTSERWRRIDSPPACREVTALVVTGLHLVAATRDSGLWTTVWNNGRAWGHWARLDAAGEAPSADIQSLAVWDGKLWAGTFDCGVISIDGAQIRQYGCADGLTANSPRLLIPAGGLLYARTADSALDEFDGSQWRAAKWTSALPRRDIYCCDYAAGRMYVGGWGGWASVHGAHIDAHYKDAALAGQLITSIAASGDRVWIGTEGKGLFCYENGVYSEFHEAQGITDDWITCIAAARGRLLVGTYTGGLLELNASRFEQVLRPERYTIRSIVFAPNGDTYAATPIGVYRARASAPRAWAPLDPRAYGGPESQCLCPTSEGVWVGGRSSLGLISTN